MMASMNEKPRWTDWINPLPNGIGTGANVTIVLIALIASVDRADMAVGKSSPSDVVWHTAQTGIAGTGISYLFRYCGQVTGVGIAGGVLQSVLETQLRSRITGPDAEKLINQIRRVSSSIPDLPPDVRDKAVISYHIALRWVFILNGCLACLNFIACLFVSQAYQWPRITI